MIERRWFVLQVNANQERAVGLGKELAEWLMAQGHRVEVRSGDTPEPAGAEPIGPEAELTRPDLVVSLGGDGTMLRAMAYAWHLDRPVLGVNLGRLGFLTEVEPRGIFSAIERFLGGRFAVENRMTLMVGLPDGRQLVGMNEVVVEKTVPGHTVIVEVLINGVAFLDFQADGLLVATPTGSTAYNLSARGPALSPTLEATVLTPIAAHSPFDRSLVLGSDEKLFLRLAGSRPAVVVLDGTQRAVIEPGEAITATAATRPARLVRLGGPDFHRVLQHKFDLRPNC